MNWPHPGTSRTVCTCRQCRRDIRLAIERVFVAEPRWMGEMTIRFHAHLGWVPMLLYRHILGRMVLLGILLKSHEPGDEFPRYLLARVAFKDEGRRMKDELFIPPSLAFRLPPSEEGGAR